MGVESTAAQKNCNRKEFKQHSLYSAINSHGFKAANPQQEQSMPYSKINAIFRKKIIKPNCIEWFL